MVKIKRHQTNHCPISSKAFKLLKENKSLVDVAITLNIDTDEVMGLYNDYLRLLNLQKLMTIYKEMGDDIYLLEHLYLDLKNEGLCSKRDIFNIVQMAGKLKSMNCELYEVAEDHIIFTITPSLMSMTSGRIILDFVKNFMKYLIKL